MNLINFRSANCKSCYKCLRYCPVKAIKIKNEQAEIDSERCIACGHCLIVCPQNARYIKSDVDEVREAIKEGKRVAASIAPSFAGVFDTDDEGQVVSGLKKLGFSIIEETAIGADLVGKLYIDYVKRNNMKNVITTCCPSVNFLIEKYYPNLIEYMLPVVSPMIAHGKMLKQTYGGDTAVVFIGPCTAKKFEAVDFQHEGIVDWVLTFEELKEWFKEENIELKKLEPKGFDRQSCSGGKIFPVSGGVLEAFNTSRENLEYDYYGVSGIEECLDIFNSITNGEVQGACIEANVCRGSCLGGPGMPCPGENIFRIQQKIKRYIQKSKKKMKENDYGIYENLNFSKLFFDRSIKRNIATDKEIEKILQSMGKFDPEDEMNCGVCGYNTCREKAQAIYEGMAEKTMCLQYMRNKAESINYVVFENTPNIIIIVDNELKIKEFNPAAERVFKITSSEAKDKFISDIIDDWNFIKVLDEKTDIYRQKVEYPKYDAVVIQNLLFIEKQNIILAIMSDITEEEKSKKELLMVKENTLNSAQRVIEKQMRVAQEIAGLLGETTAETKVILTRLKKIAMGEEYDGDKDFR